MTGKIVVTVRGTCARVARAIFGQEAGAAAVVMVNNAATLPPFEGPITNNPDTGQQFTVTIPFLGVTSTDGAKWSAADGGTATLTNKDIANPGFLAHPTWNKVKYWKAAIVNTADPSHVTGYTTRVAGSGLIQAPGATETQVVALGDTGTATLN